MFIDISAAGDQKANKGAKLPVMFVMQSKTGKAMDFLSYKSREAEVLFKPKTAFRVNHIADEGNRKIVYMVES